jgi:hypothetical protein
MLQIILVGQAELDSLLAQPAFRQFQQRVSRRFHLEPLRVDELPSYIEHRLAVARAAPPSTIPGAEELAQAMAEWEPPAVGVSFAPEAIDAIWKCSGGLPRVVNLLCDHALETAFAQKVRTIDVSSIHAAARALGLQAATDSSQEPQDLRPADEAIPVAFEAAEHGEIAAEHPLPDGPWVFTRDALHAAAVSGFLKRVTLHRAGVAVPSSGQASFDLSST